MKTLNSLWTIEARTKKTRKTSATTKIFLNWLVALQWEPWSISHYEYTYDIVFTLQTLFKNSNVFAYRHTHTLKMPCLCVCVTHMPKPFPSLSYARVCPPFYEYRSAAEPICATLIVLFCVCIRSRKQMLMDAAVINQEHCLQLATGHAFFLSLSLALFRPLLHKLSIFFENVFPTWEKSPTH